MKTYQVMLPDEIAAVADRLIAAGKFDSVDHLMMYAVSQVEGEVARDDLIDNEWLRKELQAARDQSERGEVAPLDMTAIWTRVLQRRTEEKSPTIPVLVDANPFPR
jgi:Arc/MetJ-type ribon-helix-helix transcriptional regulator